jgi:acyl transferase domain-containing protein
MEFGMLMNLCGDYEEYALGLQGSADDAGPARLSYFLNLMGPALEIKTACSSSAVAIHHGVFTSPPSPFYLLPFIDRSS